MRRRPGRFFDEVDTSSPDARLLEIAPDFPVFRIVAEAADTGAGA